MIAIPLPCNIAEYKNLAICPVNLYLGIKYILAPREFYSVGKSKMALLTLKVADPCLDPKIIPP